ncbi:DUF1963 domain-containing protein [Halpernia frigidisoli]|uniref:Uncharacterized protein YwqG n=1 Tax=Halpernia frigidisoli TaxID=1125876 RepID=A0A1I3HG04_9FLAO|nr:YwqG family protein [Halpernia frigidisoli]SFI34708.1 Uncharacterized protein YwqG [Halpernia frigidisoli]
MLKNNILKLIDESDSENKALIKSLLIPSIGFKLGIKKASFYTSKIGGIPTIEKNIIPFFRESPLTFIAQIDLSEISDMNNLFPKNGILYFFVNTLDLNNRIPDKNDEFKVLYVKDKPSINENFEYNYNSLEELPISFFEYFTLPSYQDAIISNYNVTDEELNIISEIEENIFYSVSKNFEIPNHILGHPNALQGTVKFWWAAKYLNINVNKKILESEMSEINKIQEDFVLLMQLNFGNPQIKIDCFGDSILYFGIHKEDLQSLNFKNAILVLQNT